MRNLASVQAIEEVIPHTNADKLEMAKVLGWWCVVKKDEFKPKDLVVYLEIDSILPDGPDWSEFMRPRKFRVKTIKLRGELSQGLVMPLEILDMKMCERSELHVGDDVTEKLGVTKYEIPEVQSGGVGGRKGSKTKSNFPVYLHKTDETRLQSVPAVLKELNGVTCYITTKMDGTSGTFSYLKSEPGQFGEEARDEFHVCSRKRSLVEDDSVWWEVAKRYNLEENLKNYGNICVQGEVCGPKIQQNRMKLNEIELFVFNVYDINLGKYYDFEDFVAFCYTFGLKTVPIVNDNYIITEKDTVDSFIEMAKGKYDSGFPREGIVVRPIEERYSKRLHGRSSFKVINNDFLLKVK